MGGKRGRRRLGPEERRLWERVAATASPLRERPEPVRLPKAGKRSVDPDPVDPNHADDAGAPARSATTPASHAVPRSPARSAVRWTTVSLALPEAAPVGRPEAGLDRRTAERLRKGARVPDARIDLHGMTAERAHRACLRFLGEAAGRGHRVVLVITGKGRGDRGGVLRDSLPGWLRASPLGQSIVGIYQANRRHGGDGAFYVYLKRQR